MNKKRIAILADFPWSFFADGATGRGGGQMTTWLTQLATEFSKDSPYEFHWISIDRKGWMGRSASKEWQGQYFHRIPGLKTPVDLRLGYWFSRWQLLRQLRRINPALVHCWGTETAYPSVGGHCKVPVILSMQGVLSNLHKQGFLPDHWYWNKIPKLEPGFIRRASLVTCESQWAINRVREVVPEVAARQVEYGVNPSFYNVSWTPDLVQPYALFVGTLAAYKGVDILLEALAKVKERNWGLKILGDGPLRDRVKACGIPGVEWLGILPWSDLQQQMRKAMCLVHPTLADSSPNSVKESRVIGLPVITTIHGGQFGYIRDGENGIIVNPLNSESLAKALSQIMNDPDLARVMGAARHAEDRAYFQPSNTAQGFLEIYKQLTDEFSLTTHSLNL